MRVFKSLEDAGVVSIRGNECRDRDSKSKSETKECKRRRKTEMRKNHMRRQMNTMARTL